MRAICWWTLFSLAPCLLHAGGPIANGPDLTPQFLSGDAAVSAIRGNEDDDFFSRLRPREIAAMTGTATGDKTELESRVFARDFFGEAVLEFTDAEERAVSTLVSQLQARFGEDYPTLVRRPWRFIKTRQDLCGGFSFTRGDCIVFSERTVERMLRASDDAGGNGPLQLLLHEQLHVLQRCSPKLFEPLYREIFGFCRANIVIHEWIDNRQITNPDGIDENWYVSIQSNDDAAPQPYWMGTILKGDRPIPLMGRDFSGVAVQLKPVGGHYEMVTKGENVPVYREVGDFPELSSRFPLRLGYDHPNEIAAYLLPGLLLNQPSGDKPVGRAAELLQSSQAWFEANLTRRP